jgi:hypothetical protein
MHESTSAGRHRAWLPGKLRNILRLMRTSFFLLAVCAMIQLVLVLMTMRIMTMIVMISTVHFNEQIVWVGKSSYLSAAEGLESPPGHRTLLLSFLLTVLVVPAKGFLRTQFRPQRLPARHVLITYIRSCEYFRLCIVKYSFCSQVQVYSGQAVRRHGLELFSGARIPK